MNYEKFHHSQTGRKLVRLQKSLSGRTWPHPNLYGYAEYADLLRFSSRTSRYEMSLIALRNRKASEEARRQDPTWMEDDIDG